LVFVEIKAPLTRLILHYRVFSISTFGGQRHLPELKITDNLNVEYKKYNTDCNKMMFLGLNQVY
jgi:hypothetical protein